jgi:TatD DNase family protein
MWIDTHCHLDAAEFEPDRQQVVERARAAGVHTWVLPAVSVDHFGTLQKLARELHCPYALGIHPLYVDRSTPQDLERLEQSLMDARDDPLLVAVGEIGLDFFVPGLDHERQRTFYLAQLRLARDRGLPVLLHVRRSADGLLQGLRRLEVVGGIAHAFNGSDQQAQAFIDRGFKLGFGGAMTFDRALRIRHLAQSVPMEAVVLETDAPDIPPQWLYRTAAERAAGRLSRNEPSELPRIAQSLAELRAMSLVDVATRTALNARQALPALDRLLAL